MRNALSMLLIISAFFISSCGMPQYILYPEYDYNKGSSNNPNISSLKIWDDDNGTTGKLLENCDGPSLAFFYVLSNNPTSSYVDGCISTFGNQFRQNGYQGVVISTSDNIILPFTDNSLSQHLFLLSGKGDSSQATFKSPNYMVSINSGVSVLNASIKDINLESTDVTDTNPSANKALKLQFTSTEYSYQGDSTQILYRYNGRPFVSSTNLDTESSYKNEDYENISSGDNVYAHLFSAFCISPNNSSDFNNIFWSSLTYMGYIQLF